QRRCAIDTEELLYYLPYGIRERRSRIDIRKEQKVRPLVDASPLFWLSISQRALSFGAVPIRSEEHTSELQSRENLVCRLLLEKKKNTHNHATLTGCGKKPTDARCRASPADSLGRHSRNATTRAT